MLRNIVAPELCIDQLRLPKNDVFGFTELTLDRVAAELQTYPDVPERTIGAVERAKAGQSTPGEFLLASWENASQSRIIRPNGLLHVEVERERYKLHIRPVGTIALLDTCEKQGTSPESVERVLGEIAHQLEDNYNMRTDVLPETEQALHIIKSAGI